MVGLTTGPSKEEPVEKSYEEEFAELWGAPEPEPAPDEAEEEVVTDETVAGDEVEEKPDEPAPTESKETPPAAKPEEPKSTPAPAPDPYAWIANLPEEVRAQAERLKHSAVSDRGRVAANARELANLKRELDVLKAQPRSASTATQKPNTVSESAAPKLPKVQQLKEDFPQFADAVEELSAHTRAEFEEKLSQALAPIEQKKIEDARNSFDSAVDVGSQEIFKSDSDDWYWKNVVTSDDFLAWLDMQPKSMQKAANVLDVDEALYVLKRYKQDYDAAVVEMGLDLTEPPAGSATEADKVKARRDKRQAAAVAPPSRPVTTDSQAGLSDYEAEFNRQWGRKKS